MIEKPTPPAPPVVLDNTPLETLIRLRAEYPALVNKRQIADLLFRTARQWRHTNLALLGKKGGNVCPLTDGTPISCDFLIYSETMIGYDVLINTPDDSTPVAPAEPAWQGPFDLKAGVVDGSRWIVRVP